MANCTFFGHRDTPKEIELTLKSALIDLIENKGVDLFYVGNEGNFDFLVRECLRSLKFKYRHIKYAVVLAYMPGEKRGNDDGENYTETIYPDGLERVPLKYAISRRNTWMLDRSDYVITYVKHRAGGAGKFKELAEKKGKVILNLAEPANNL